MAAVMSPDDYRRSSLVKQETRVAKALEGEFREGPYHLPVSNGWLPESSSWNFWQQGYDVKGKGDASSAIVQACVSAYAQTAAMCPGSHWRVLANGGRERVTASALSRILQKPNAYQSPSDFLLNLTSRLYRTGNAYAVALRNNRFEVAELHIMHEGSATIAPTGDIFYSLSGNEVIERQIGADVLKAVPARDVLHVRLETPRHPLLGESPLMAAALDLAASNAMVRQAVAFFDRQARPSGTLNTDANLTVEQVQILRQRWDEQSRGLNAGGTPILSNGLKWNPMTQSARDNQLAEIMKMSQESVALAFRVPLQVLGIGTNTYATTESLMNSWLASGLGFCLNHIEVAFDRLFGLAGTADTGSAYGREYTEFDTSSLLRSNFKERMEGLGHALEKGVMSPNEIAGDEGLPSRGAAGAEPRVQQQVVPLSYNLTPPEPVAPPAPEPANDTDEEAPDEAAQARQMVELLTRGVHDRLARDA